MVHLAGKKEGEKQNYILFSKYLGSKKLYAFQKNDDVWYIHISGREYEVICDVERYKSQLQERMPEIVKNKESQNREIMQNNVNYFQSHVESIDLYQKSLPVLYLRENINDWKVSAIL